MLDGRVMDSTEGEAIAFNHKYVDIYSASLQIIFKYDLKIL
jgi:hypothetical protein